MLMINTILWFISLVLVLPSVSYAALSQEEITINLDFAERRLNYEQAEPFIAKDESAWCPVGFKNERSTKIFDRALYSVTLITSTDVGRTFMAMPDFDPFNGDQLLELLRSFECGDR
jgi:hypothetical protein